MNNHSARPCPIQWMLRENLPSVLAIENASYAAPWDETTFVRTLRDRAVVGMVAVGESGSTVMGYMIYRLLHGHIKVLNFAVAPAFRRQGVGSAMVNKLLAKLEPGHKEGLSFAVRETNLGMQLLLRSCGIRAREVVHGHFPEEAAYVFEYHVSTSAGVCIGI